MSLIFQEYNNTLNGGENNADNNIVFTGGISARFQKESVDEPIKRFENLVVPIGLYNIKKEEEIERESDSDDHSFIDEKRFSQLFYSVAKDLGSSRTKPKNSVTKKNRQ